MFKHDWVVAMVTNLVLQAETAKTNVDHTYQIITEAARKEVNTSSLFHNQLSLYSCNMIYSKSQLVLHLPTCQVELFKEHHTQVCRSSLVQYVESQVSHCKQTYTNLAKLKEELENLPTPN